jgi:hypothetical protein
LSDEKEEALVAGEVDDCSLDVLLVGVGDELEDICYSFGELFVRSEKLKTALVEPPS